MAEVEASLTLDGVAVHPDCWYICLCYLHFAPENPEDGEMYRLVPLTWVVPDKVQRAVKWLCVCCSIYEHVYSPCKNKCIQEQSLTIIDKLFIYKVIDNNSSCFTVIIQVVLC